MSPLSVLAWSAAIVGAALALVAATLVLIILFYIIKSLILSVVKGFSKTVGEPDIEPEPHTVELTPPAGTTRYTVIPGAYPTQDRTYWTGAGEQITPQLKKKEEK